MKTACFILIAVLFFSCGKSKMPSDIIPPAKMEQLLWEQMKADAFTKEFVVKDTTKDLKAENLALQERIFQKYHTDKSSFYKSYRYYLSHEELMKTILDSIIAKEGKLKERDRMKLLKRHRDEQDKK